MENLNEHGKFLTLAAPSPPVPLTPKSYQLIQIPQLSNSNPEIIPFSSNDYGDRLNIPRSWTKEPKKGLPNVDVAMDPKKLKKLMANRASALKSRIKKLQYVADLEKRAKELELWVALLASKVVMYRGCKLYLDLENANLKRQLAKHEAYSQCVAVEIAEKKGEVTRLMKTLSIKEESECQMVVEENGISEPLATQM